MHRCTAALATTLLVVTVDAVTSSCLGGPNPEAKLALHLQNPSKSSCCDYAFTDCAAISTSRDTTGTLDALVVLYDFIAMRALEYTLSWPEGFVFEGFVSCSDLTMTNLDEAGRAITVAQTWTEVFVPAGGTGMSVGRLRLTAEASGSITILPSSVTGTMNVVGPELGTLECCDEVSYAANAGIAGVQGDPPCEPSP